MTGPARPPDTDDEHLRLLSIFHYVAAGLAALASLFPLIHVAMGVLMVSGGFPGHGKGEEEFGRAFGWFFILFAGGMILAGLTFAACLAYAGRCLGARRRYTFCLVTAALACMFVPLGTVLGVFTLVVLLREGVKERFATPVLSGGRDP